MWFIFLFLVTGIFVGFLFRQQKNMLATATKATSLAVIVLIFFLGISVGDNQKVMSTLGVLGGQALVISFGSIFGSVLLSGVVYLLFFRGIHEK